MTGLKPKRIDFHKRLTYGDRIEAIDCGGIFENPKPGTIGTVVEIRKEGLQYEVQWESGYKHVTFVYKPRDKYIKL
jgi:hypothetical protein